MRELIFKNLTKATSSKMDVSLEEIVERQGIVSSTMKRSIYFVSGVHHVKSREDLEDWIHDRNKNVHVNKKFFHILRSYSDRENEDKLVCKMRGSFYIVAGTEAYNIVFVHSIKIRLQKMLNIKE